MSNVPTDRHWCYAGLAFTGHRWPNPDARLKIAGHVDGRSAGVMFPLPIADPLSFQKVMKVDAVLRQALNKPAPD